MTFDTAIAGSGIVAVSVTGDGREQDLRGGAGQAARRRAEGARRRQSARDRLRAARRHASRSTPRSCARSAPATTSSPICRRRRRWTTVAKPWVALGAHYDHLGHGEAGNTLAGKDDAGKIHLGADDNASGSAAVLAIAATLAKQPRKRNVLVGFWSGEELGLIGSSAFSTTPPVPLDAIAAYLNFDMVGRMQDNKLTVQATGIEPGVGQDHRAGERRRRLRPRGAGGSVSADRRRHVQRGEHPVAELLHRHARRLSQAVRHGRQDRLRGSRSRRRLRRRDRAAASRTPPRRRSSRRSISSCSRAPAAPACGCSPARFPTTPPR